ncbi:MAG: molybdopterin-dependent oxidoreductase [Pseudomonadota bacterium]
MKALKFKAILRLLPAIFALQAWRSATYRAFLTSRDCVVQVVVADHSVIKHLVFKGGKIRLVDGMHAKPDVIMRFRDLETALATMTPPIDYGEAIHNGKTFRVILAGDDEAIAWFTQLASKLSSDGWDYGEKMPDGSMRYTQISNGGPLHVYVKDGRILRTNLIEFSDTDPQPWTMTARGKTFSPQRKALVAPHALALKGNVYAENRALYPMKRVDFDPDGDRNPQNRGKSGYERISWDEALEIVSKEILRQKQVHGPGAIALTHPSHHQWGNIGYYLSAMMRFGNAIGVTRVVLNPDSWEGWYWGAMHHHGGSMRLGLPAGYGTLQDAMDHAEQIVYWASDPESQFGAYGGTEMCERRLWAKELGIESIHINPHYSPTAAFAGGKWIGIKPGTDTALALALMHVWITEDSYDHHFVENRSTGFDEWKAYILGQTDGVAKTPEWQEAETGVPAREARALARLWAKKKTYLSCGVSGIGMGGACRNATGIQWARAMVMLMAMQGWGKPGVNFGCLGMGAPVDLEFYFPGYGEGGISGELNATGSATHNYVRMPHLISVNPVSQKISRPRLADAILTGKSEGYEISPMSLEGQFAPFHYPAPGHSKVRMLYRYGGSALGTTNGSTRLIEMYQSQELECVVNQTVWNEGESQFADIILPACTQFERWDIGEWNNAGGFGHHWYNGTNHRVVAIQHKCIEPRGESKSDYQIFWDICNKLGLGAYYSEGCSELDWAKRIFESTDVARHLSWKQFLKKGYFVVPPEVPERATNVDMNWFYEGRSKDLPEPFPLPGGYNDKFLHGLQTQSGKFEFIPSSLKRLDPPDPDRPPLMQYAPPFEAADRQASYPIRLITPHQRFSFHTAQDGKGNTLSDLPDHRVLVDGHYYWIVRISEADAAARGIHHHGLVKVYNDRAAVICAAEVTSRMAAGVVHSYESSAVYQPMGDPGSSPDIGGCMNMLAPARMQSGRTVASAGSMSMVQIEKWDGVDAVAAE